MPVTQTGSRSSSLVAGIGEMIATTDPTATLVTYSLGSCIGVSIYDPEVNFGALIHCMLPSSKVEQEKAAINPHRYTDTGIVAMLQTAFDHGADRSRMQIRVAGGAAPMDACGRFKIGERNFATLRKVLWKNNLLLQGEDVGGTQPRTMTLYMPDGRVTVRKGREEAEL